LRRVVLGNLFGIESVKIIILVILLIDGRNAEILWPAIIVSQLVKTTIQVQQPVVKSTGLISEYYSGLI
jgi:hypothetical protein